jgi:hypothetical protein
MLDALSDFVSMKRGRTKNESTDRIRFYLHVGDYGTVNAHISHEQVHTHLK